MLELDRDTRDALFRRLGEILERHVATLRERPIAPRDYAAQTFDFATPIEPHELLERVAHELEHGQVHTGHPAYFGLFNPAPAALSIIADALVAAFNPQLATRSHAPFAVDIEDQLLRAFAGRFGFAEGEGAFTSGGAEANTTALLAALTTAFPEVSERGVRALSGDPCLYVSAEAHPTIARAARVAGLGSAAVRVIPCDARLRMKTGALREAIARDRKAGALPFMIVATAGTTSAGTIDPLDELADLAERASLWLHVDAAWGGMLALIPELAGALGPIGRADSITFDPHKALSIPMGAGMVLLRRPGVLASVFADRAGYMPRNASRDPYARSMQWSRRFIGLKLFCALAAEGWDGYAATLRGLVALADRLREGLRASGWILLNETPLPLVCFVDRDRRDGRFLDAIARAVIASGGGWISMTRLSNGERALRACVNNHRTEARDIDRLVAALDEARANVSC